MKQNLEFNKNLFDCFVGGMPILNVPHIDIHDRNQARDFILAYGYDVSDQNDVNKLWYFHRRAVTLIREKLLFDDEEIPSRVADPSQLGQLEDLLILASQRASEFKDLQRWSCAILRVMHVFVHLENDLFSVFFQEIQQQILRPIQRNIWVDPATGLVHLGFADEGEVIDLHRFDIKPFKTTSSSVIKLLARSDLVAFALLDKLGFRFVTKSLFDALKVLRFLGQNNLISYPHVISDQTNNTLYPVNLLLEVMEELKMDEGKTSSDEEIDEILRLRLLEKAGDVEYFNRQNFFSGLSYRMMKFICRKLVHVSVNGDGGIRNLSFFYPFEVQIMDYETYVNNLTGPGAHNEYKERQRKAARLRVMLGQETNSNELRGISRSSGTGLF